MEQDSSSAISAELEALTSKRAILKDRLKRRREAMGSILQEATKDMAAIKASSSAASNKGQQRAAAVAAEDEAKRLLLSEVKKPKLDDTAAQEKTTTTTTEAQQSKCTGQQITEGEG